MLQKYMLALLVFLGGLGNICHAQSNNPAPWTLKWGEIASCGVQLSVGLTNDTLRTGHEFILDVNIRNLMTNVACLEWIDTKSDFAVYLIDDIGKKVRITPEPDRGPHFSRSYFRLVQGETYEWPIPITIGKEMKHGHYKLQAARDILAVGDKNEDIFCLAESNVIDVQVE